MSFDRPEFKQIVSNYYAKCLQIILESRIPSFASSTHYGEDSAVSNVTSSSPSTGPDSKGCSLNLILGQFGPRLEKLVPWCIRMRKPMVIDILVSQSNGGGMDRLSGAATPLGQLHTYGGSKSSFIGTSERHLDLTISSSQCTSVLERWVVQYEGPTLKEMVKAKRTTKSGDGHCGKNSSKAAGEGCSVQYAGRGFSYQKEPVGSALKDCGEKGRATGRVGTGGHFPQISVHALDSSAVYNRTVIMLRSLYCTSRLLPAHSFFRNACSSHSCSFTLSYRILVSSPPLSQFENVKDMILHNFTPVESLYGRMCLSVAYRHKIHVTAFETAPIMAQIIPEYVDSLDGNLLKQISNDWHYKGASERRDVHLLSVPESVQSSPTSFHNCSRANNARFSCETLVVREERDDSIAPSFINDRLCTLVPSTIPIKSSGCDDAQDDELSCPFAVDDRMSTVGTLERMLGSAAPLRCTQQHPSGTGSGQSLETSWTNVDREFFQYLSDEIKMYALSAFDAGSNNPVVGQTEHQLKRTMSDALEEFQVYKEIRDSLLN